MSGSAPLPKVGKQQRNSYSTDKIQSILHGEFAGEPTSDRTEDVPLRAEFFHTVSQRPTREQKDALLARIRALGGPDDHKFPLTYLEHKFVVLRKTAAGAPS